MIKTLLKHIILEKCIEIVFDGIAKSFKQPERRYEIIDKRTEGPDENGILKTTITYKIKGETHTMVMQQHESTRGKLMETGMTRQQAERELEDVLLFEIESQVRATEIGSKAAWEETNDNLPGMEGVPPLPVGSFGEGFDLGEIPEVSLEDISRREKEIFNSFPPEIKKQFEEAKKQFEDGGGFDIEFESK